MKTSFKSMGRGLAAAALSTAILVATSGAASASAGFGDVPDGAYYEDAVTWMVAEGITLGTEPGCFSPDAAVTRGQIAAFLHRIEVAEGLATKYPRHPFSDVVQGWQQEAVSWLLGEGITAGLGPDTFGPEKAVTRGELAVFLHRAAGAPADGFPAHGFSDVVQWQDQAVSWLVAQGITLGTSETTFSPNDPVTRGQAAAFLWRRDGKPAVSAPAEASPACGQATIDALTAAGITGSEAGCVAGYLQGFTVAEMRGALNGESVPSPELVSHAASAFACFSSDRIHQLADLYIAFYA